MRVQKYQHPLDLVPLEQGQVDTATLDPLLHLARERGEGCIASLELSQHSGYYCESQGRSLARFLSDEPSMATWIPGFPIEGGAFRVSHGGLATHCQSYKRPVCPGLSQTAMTNEPAAVWEMRG